MCAHVALFVALPRTEGRQEVPASPMYAAHCGGYGAWSTTSKPVRLCVAQQRVRATTVGNAGKGRLLSPVRRSRRVGGGSHPAQSSPACSSRARARPPAFPPAWQALCVAKSSRSPCRACWGAPASGRVQCHHEMERRELKQPAKARGIRHPCPDSEVERENFLPPVHHAPAACRP